MTSKNCLVVEMERFSPLRTPHVEKHHKKKKKHHSIDESCDVDVGEASVEHSPKKDRKKKKHPSDIDAMNLDETGDNENKSSKKHKKKKKEHDSKDPGNCPVTRDILDIADSIQSRLDGVDDGNDTSSSTSHDIFLTQNRFQSPSKRVTDSQISNEVHTNLLMKNYGHIAEGSQENFEITGISSEQPMFTPEKHKSKKKKKKRKSEMLEDVRMELFSKDYNNNASSKKGETQFKSPQVGSDVNVSVGNVVHPERTSSENQQDIDGSKSKKRHSSGGRSIKIADVTASSDDENNSAEVNEDTSVENRPHDKVVKNLGKESAVPFSGRRTDQAKTNNESELHNSESDDSSEDMTRHTENIASPQQGKKKRLSLNKGGKRLSESETVIDNRRLEDDSRSGEKTEKQHGAHNVMYNPPDDFSQEHFDPKLSTVRQESDENSIEYFLIRAPLEFDVKQLSHQDIILGGKHTISCQDESDQRIQFEIQSHPESVLEKGKYVPLLWDESGKKLTSGPSIMNQILVAQTIDVPQMPARPITKNSKQAKESTLQNSKKKATVSTKSSSEPGNLPSDIQITTSNSKHKKKSKLHKENMPKPEEKQASDDIGDKTSMEKEINSDFSAGHHRKHKKSKKKKKQEESTRELLADLSPSETLDPLRMEVTSPSESNISESGKTDKPIISVMPIPSSKLSVHHERKTESESNVKKHHKKKRKSDDHELRPGVMLLGQVTDENVLEDSSDNLIKQKSPKKHKKSEAYLSGEKTADISSNENNPKISGSGQQGADAHEASNTTGLFASSTQSLNTCISPESEMGGNISKHKKKKKKKKKEVCESITSPERTELEQVLPAEVNTPRKRKLSECSGDDHNENSLKKKKKTFEQDQTDHIQSPDAASSSELMSPYSNHKRKKKKKRKNEEK